MIKTYRTISGRSEGLFKDRGSRFLAFSFPVSSEEEIASRLEELRKKYYDARHHCYAWKLGFDPVRSRSNDDGEPSNSAGKPILNQLDKYELTNTLVVVIRYFGGTLLGVGGLINAYRSAAAEAIEANQIETRHIYRRYLVAFEYPALNEVMKVVKDFDIETFDQKFEISCSMGLKVELEKEERVMEALDRLYTIKVKRLADEDF